MELVINMESIKMMSVNAKYNFNPVIGRLILSKKYREFKELLIESCLTQKLSPPYEVEIHMDTYLDIDNPLKCILDSLVNVIENDKYIYSLKVLKHPIKRGREGSLKVYVGTMENLGD